MKIERRKWEANHLLQPDRKREKMIHWFHTTQMYENRCLCRTAGKRLNFSKCGTKSHQPIQQRGKVKKKNANASENTVNSVTVKTAHYTEHSIAPTI